SIIGFSTLVMGVSFASEFGFDSLIVLALLVIAIITLFFYTKRQLTLTEPILNLRIFKLRDFSVGASLVMIDFAIILSAMYLLPQYIQNGLLLPVALTGIIMLPGGIVNAIVSAIAGRLYDKNGATTPVQIGFTLALIGAVMLAFTST
ncbi:MFS transporter, partial [Campylobacter jejuni]|nr:MFS transporter [Campylobacter jejuni]